MQPLVSIEFTDNNHEACVTVYTPKRIMHHLSRSKFELRNYKYVVETENGETIDLGMTAAEFSEDCSYHVVKLPPQVCRVLGKLKVGAVYGDGRVEFSRPTEFEMPCYGKYNACMHDTVFYAFGMLSAWPDCPVHVAPMLTLL